MRLPFCSYAALTAVFRFLFGALIVMFTMLPLTKSSCHIELTR